MLSHVDWVVPACSCCVRSKVSPGVSTVSSTKVPLADTVECQASNRDEDKEQVEVHSFGEWEQWSGLTPNVAGGMKK